MPLAAKVAHDVTHGSGPRGEVPNTLVAAATLEARPANKRPQIAQMGRALE